MAEELPKRTERCSQPSWEDCLLILNDPLSVPMSPTLCLFLDPPRAEAVISPLGSPGPALASFPNCGLKYTGCPQLFPPVPCVPGAGATQELEFPSRQRLFHYVTHSPDKSQP